MPNRKNKLEHKENHRDLRFVRFSCPRCKSKKMIRFAWESGAELECTECGERFDEEDLLTIDDPSNILTVKEKLAFIRAFKESD